MKKNYHIFLCLQFLFVVQTIAQNNTEGIFAHLKTNKGTIVLQLDYEHVPMTAANFIGLAEGAINNQVFGKGEPYFNGTIWHRVVPGHVIQAGMPVSKDTLEGPGYEFPNEIYSGLSHNKAGMFGMANAGPHTNGSQFYITLGDRSYLDGNYTLFGWVVDGMDIVYKITQGDTIKSVNITRNGNDAKNFTVTNDSFIKMVDDAKDQVKINEQKKKLAEDEWVKINLPDAMSTNSGIKYQIIKEGTGEKPAARAIVKVKYTGKILLGSLSFVSTSDDGKPNFGNEAVEFNYTLGTTKINTGIDEIIAEMKPGERRIVIVPSNLAYGTTGFYAKSIPGQKRFVISPNSSLYYEIEIL